MRFAVIGIGPVTFEAFIGKNGADIEIKANDIRQGSCVSFGGEMQTGGSCNKENDDQG
jgi:hypothetical protein